MHKKENNVVGNIRKFIRLDILVTNKFWWQIGGNGDILKISLVSVQMVGK